MKKILILLLILPFVSEITFSQQKDSLVNTNKVEFIKKLKEINGYVYPIVSKEASVFVKIPFGTYLERSQILLKIQNDIFLRLDGTGFLFRLTSLNDSVASFRRIDQTVNINYSISSFNFIDGNDIYNYGGYGFWRNNGMVRKYDAKSKEWSILKTNLEIPQQIFSINNAWFDYKTHNLFTPFEFDIHAGLKENDYQYGKITNRAYQLNLKTNDWSVLGITSESTIKILKDATLDLNTERGLLVLAFEQLYLFDFVNNKILKQNDNVFAQLYMRITDKNSVFHFNKTLYSGEIETGKLDSVHLDLDTFQPIEDPIYRPIKDYSWAWILSGVLLLIAIFIAIRFTIEKRVEKLKTAGGDIRNFKFEFSDIEKGLINMLLEKSKSNQTATISEINYVLGVKDKNIGLQKKVRSEVFNAVNEKFKLISDWDEPLVQSIRSESDKRYFEYMIRKDMIKEAERVMQD